MTTKPARRIEYLPLDDLTEDDRNPKDHDLGTVHVSISRFGMIDPIVRDERTGKLIAGHGRRQALLGMRDRGEEPPEGIRTDNDGNWLAPVLTGWSSRSDSEAGAALIALNRTTELGGWANDSLLELLADLAQDPDGLEGVGYDADDIDALAALLEQGVSDLDALADEYGAPTDEDSWQNYTLKLPTDLIAALEQALGTYQGDTDAARLRQLLNTHPDHGGSKA